MGASLRISQAISMTVNYLSIDNAISKRVREKETMRPGKLQVPKKQKDVSSRRRNGTKAPVNTIIFPQKQVLGRERPCK